MSQTSWTITPVENPNDPAAPIFNLPEDEMRVAGWQPGHPLAWKDNEDGTWTVALKILTADE